VRSAHGVAGHGPSCRVVGWCCSTPGCVVTSGCGKNAQARRGAAETVVMRDFTMVLLAIAGLFALASLVLIEIKGAEKLCWTCIALVGLVGALARTGLG
jgi:hypothetical protein